MSYTHKITRTIQLPGNVIISGEKALTAGLEINISDNQAQSSGPTLYALAIDVSQLKSLFIMSSTDATIHTNASDGTGGDTLNLKAGQPVIWQTNDSVACPLTLDVTGLYLTIGAVGASGCDFSLSALVDPTI